MRAAVRGEISGVERWAAEVGGRLAVLDPALYRTVAPPSALTEGPAGHAWEQFALPLIAARRRAALVFSPANVAPVAWPRSVVVIHDAAVFREPEAYSPAYVALHRRLERLAARRALAVLTVSQFARRELSELTGVPAAAITVVGGGVGERFELGSARSDRGRVSRRFGLSRPYVLTVATADARKNLTALIPTAAALGARGIDLIRAGGTRPQFADDPQSAAHATGIRSLGYVPDADLPGLYAGALAFVMPSRYEGFGLPCLEAMACGTPVVAADRGGLPEACGGAGLLVDPERAGELAHAVLRAATDGGTRRRLIAAGLARAERAGWSAVVGRVDTVLRAQTAATGR